MTTDRDAAMRLAQVAKETLVEFRQQDDYLLAHDASLMSEDSHEILHLDNAVRLVQAGYQLCREEFAKEHEALERERNALRELLGNMETLICDSSFACSFQTMSQYRSALRTAIIEGGAKSE